MYGHLVTVKIGVERRADQRMQLNCFAFYQNRLKSLNAQPVQSGRAVQHHRVFADHFIQNIPYFRTLFFNKFLSLLYRA